MTADRDLHVDSRVAAARSYVERGWYVFVLGEDKQPLPNCPRCPSHNGRDAAGNRHDAEACTCLTCHGFYAATRDVTRVEEMLRRHPGGLLAVRTGAPSGIVVIDAEGESKPRPLGTPSGVEVLEHWDEYVSDVTLPKTLTQRTTSGGFHLVYAVPDGIRVRSRNRVLPSVDVKGDGGYVALPPSGERRWLDPDVPVARPGDDLVEWLLTVRGHRHGEQNGTRTGDRPDGYDAGELSREGATAGVRDEYFNDVAFRLRKAGVPRDLAERSLRAAWEKTEQPAGDEYDWEHVVAKMDRIWDTVDPDGNVPPAPPPHVPSSNGVRPLRPVRDASPPAGDAGDDRGNDASDDDTDMPIDDAGDHASVPDDARGPALIGTGPENPHRTTDRANGIEISRFLDRKALWVPEGRVGWQWYVWDGRRWIADKERVTMLLVGEYTDQLRRLATSGTLPREEAESLMTRAGRVENAGGLRAALTFAEPLVAKSVTEFDTDPWVLNCPNGVLDLRTGELRNHHPDDLLTRLCPTPYDPDARDEVWERVLREALENDVDRMRVLARFAGYTLTGLTSEKKFLILSGPANTGKSTVAEALYYTLGDVSMGGYATTWDADVVQASQQVNRGEKLSKSRPARMVLVGELAKGARMADNFVKQLTGGDTMDAKALYESSFSFRPQSKLWMATNYIPASADPALHDRMHPLPFVHVPAVKDRSIKRHLEEDEGAHRAILAWAVRSCVQWQRARSLGETPWRDGMMAEFIRSSDHLQDFIEQRLVRVDDSWHVSATVDEVYTAYSFWAAENVRNPLLKRKFCKALDERSFRRARGPHNVTPTKWIGWQVSGAGE